MCLTEALVDREAEITRPTNEFLPLNLNTPKASLHLPLILMHQAPKRVIKIHAPVASSGTGLSGPAPLRWFLLFRRGDHGFASAGVDEAVIPCSHPTAHTLGPATGESYPSRSSRQNIPDPLTR
jgi:hypothetical protein